MGIAKMTSPRTATIYLTDHCQYACKHCFLTDQGRLNKHHLSTGQIDHVVEVLAKHKAYMHPVSGGDPTLSPHFEYALRKLHENNMLALLGLNATAYSKETKEFISSLGIKKVQVGLDSLQRQHIQAKPGVFEASTWIDDLQKYFDVTVNVTLTADNFHEFAELTDELLHRGVEKVRFNLWRTTAEGRDAGIKRLIRPQIERLQNWAQTQPEGAVEIVAPRNTMPKLTILADGTITLSELHKSFGTIEGDFVESYLAHLERRAQPILSKLMQPAENIIIVRREQINASARVYIMHGKPRVLLADDLSKPEQALAYLHEMGHVELGLLGDDYDRSQDPDVERRVNLWAVAKFRPVVSDRFYQRAKGYAQDHDEDGLWTYFRRWLYHHLVLEAELIDEI